MNSIACEPSSSVASSMRMKWLVVTLLSISIVVHKCHANPLTITQLDIGEGSALLIVDNEKALLFDSGNLKSAASLQKKIAKRTPQLWGIILSHPHLDHIGGAFTLLPNFSSENFWDNGQPIDNPEDPYRWYQDLRNEHKGYRTLRAQQEVTLERAKLKVLWPPPGKLDSDWNKNSLVLRLTFGKFCAILMADALLATETELLNSKDINCPVLQVGHHGSKFASGEEFIKMVRPKDSIISVNAGNIRGYPEAAVLERLRRFGSQVHITSEHGDIEIQAQENGSYEISHQK